MNHNNSISKIRVPRAKYRQHLGKLYIITDDSIAFDMIKTGFQVFPQELSLFPLTPVQIINYSDINDNALEKSLKEDEATLCSMLFDPVAGEPLFLVQRFTSGNFILEAIDFASEVDKEIRSVFTSFAEGHIGELAQFCKSTHWGTLDFECIKLSSDFRGRKKKAQLDAEYAQDKANFTQNIQAYRRSSDSNADAAIINVIKRLPESSKLLIIKSYISTLSDDEVMTFYEKYIDMDAVAKKSRIQIIVRERLSDYEHSDDSTLYEDIKDGSTKGIYRILYKFGDDDERGFDFTTRAETTVFLCCLMSKYEFGDADVDFSQMKEKFIGAFRFLYGVNYQTAAEVYKTLLDDEFGQGRLKDYISNIRKAIDKELLDKENPAIFYYKRNGHLGLLKERITLPKGISEEVTRLSHQNEDARIF